MLERAENTARPGVPGADLADRPGRGRASLAEAIDRVLPAADPGVSSVPVVFSAVPTLFGAAGELDLAANRALYEFVAGLVDGLFVAGTTGEFPALDDAERLSLFELALAEAGPDRVIAHIGAPDARHAARLAQAAAALGADPPRRDHALLPARAPRRAERPLPAHPGRRARSRALRLYFSRTDRAARATPAVCPGGGRGRAGGAKVSGSAAADLADYVAAAPGLAIFSGNDADPAATMRAGGAGVISGRSSAYPEVYAALRHRPEQQARLDRSSPWARASAASSTRSGARPGRPGRPDDRRPPGAGDGRRDRRRGRLLLTLGPQPARGWPCPAGWLDVHRPLHWAELPRSCVTLPAGREPPAGVARPFV